jgi:hypothetical protein
MMRIPDDTYFSSNPWGEGKFSFKEARQIDDSYQKIELVKHRISEFFVEQVKPLSSTELDEKGQFKIWSPFPLAYLTFLGIETLGRIIQDEEVIEAKYPQDTSKMFSRPIYTMIDRKLSQPPTNQIKKEMRARLNKKNLKIERYSDIFHSYMRNTYAHGFQGALVQLNHKLQVGWGAKNGRIILNPYWFWNEFERVFYLLFDEMLDNPNSQKGKNAVKYYDRLIQ